MYKSVTRVVSKRSNISQGNNGYRARMPKTRFNLNDRSISSPRLKSFPAERINRIERSTAENSPQNDNMLSRQTANTGQGDTMTNFPNSQLKGNYAMPSENRTSTSEQQVSHNVNAMENRINHSDLVIPSNPMEISSNSSPQHRPNVPNVCPANATIIENSPRKLIVERSNETSQIMPSDQIPKIIDREIVEQRDTWKTENDSMQQVNGQHIENFSEINRSNIVTNYDTVKNNNDYQPLRRQLVEMYSGMTSPQDVAINQIKNERRSLELGNYVNGSNQQQNGWICNNQLPRVIDNHMPMVCSNIPQYYNYPVDNGTHGMTNQHRYFPVNWQQPMHQQYYNQQNALTRQIPQRLSNNVKFVDDQNVRCQSLQQRIPLQHENPDGKWQVTQQQQHFHQQNERPSQISQRPNVKFDNNHRTIEDKRKSLRFSPAMIRDQELLVTTMRQQGINEDIMRRQFDGLLTEQRKQLLYLEQLENPRTNEETRNLQQCRRVKSRISRNDEDGKPEWMLHITPPRIPYSVMEKMQSERQFESRVMERKNPNVVEMNSGNKPQNQTKEMYDRISQDHHQYPCQMMADSNVWQTQPRHSHITNDLNITRENQAYHTANDRIALNQYRQRYHDYPVYHQQNFVHKFSPENCQRHDDNNASLKQQQHEQHDKNDKTLLPSSLLKLRIYKDVIKRQKQNNGLQDPETIKEAIEALKNPANRKGLEYLEFMNKKRTVSLNGAQDPHEMTSIELYDDCTRNRQTMKIPSSNGLENTRNSNNPLPRRETLRQRKIDDFHELEYPRQRKYINSQPLDCYSLPAERENIREIKCEKRQCTRAMNPENNTNVQETVTIGGIKFLARKPEYTQSAISSQHYPTYHGRGFNPMIACQ